MKNYPEKRLKRKVSGVNMKLDEKYIEIPFEEPIVTWVNLRAIDPVKAVADLDLSDLDRERELRKIKKRNKKNKRKQDLNNLRKTRKERTTTFQRKVESLYKKKAKEDRLILDELITEQKLNHIEKHRELAIYMLNSFHKYRKELHTEIINQLEGYLNHQEDNSTIKLNLIDEINKIFKTISAEREVTGQSYNEISCSIEEESVTRTLKDVLTAFLNKRGLCVVLNNIMPSRVSYDEYKALPVNSVVLDYKDGIYTASCITPQTKLTKEEFESKSIFLLLNRDLNKSLEGRKGKKTLLSMMKQEESVLKEIETLEESLRQKGIYKAKLDEILNQL